jgi:flagellar hook-basal body complex protein FliE
MSDMMINDLMSSGGALANKTAGAKNPGNAFDAVLTDAFNKVASLENEADKAIASLSQGGEISDAVIAMEKADMSFSVMIEVRNKLVSAYEDIMRIQV